MYRKVDNWTRRLTIRMERDETKLTKSIEELQGEIQELNKSREEDGNKLAEAIEGLKDLTKNVGEKVEPLAEEPDLAVPAAELMPKLNRMERVEIAKRASPRAVVVLEAVREEGERELARSPLALAISGLAAGLSMGFSLVAEGLLHSVMPVPFRGFIENFGYSLGFLFVVLGRQQLFTENTLTVIVPLLTRPNWDTFRRIIRLWTIVLVANLVGGLIFAAVIAHSALFPAQIVRSFVEVASGSLRGGFGLTVLRGIFAGWLIALMVWLLPSTDGTRLHIIILITYFVALGGFAHIIAGSIEVLYLVNLGVVSWFTFFIGFMIPTLIGNIIGGVLLVAMLNFGQVAAELIGSGDE
jgi:formate/nitrite transporter FocA (FNT family)